MAQVHENSHPHIMSTIKHLWFHLSDEEIAHYEDMRDVFFMAIRKKYGITRAEAENMLRNVSDSVYEDAA